MAGPGPTPPAAPALPKSAARFGFGDQLFDASTLFAGRHHGDELLPRADRPGRVLLRLIQHLTAVEQRGWVLGVDRQRALERLERRVRVAADRDDEAQVGQRVHVLGIALEDRLIRGDCLTVASLEEARARGTEHALEDPRACGPRRAGRGATTGRSTPRPVPRPPSPARGPGP